MVVIHIDGIQGSGKSYICKELYKIPNVKCVDTDDIMRIAYEKIKHNKKFIANYIEVGQPVMMIKHMIKMRDKLIKMGKNNVVIFVGMTMEIPNPDYKFFIKLDDTEAVYRRLMKREINKIVSNSKEVLKKLSNDNVHLMGFDLSTTFGIGIVPIVVDYDEFLRNYNEKLVTAKKDNYEILSQEKIIKKLKSIIQPKI